MQCIGSITVALVACVSLEPGRVSANDVIDMAQLGERGVVFETLPDENTHAIRGAAGVGDVDGDGLDDLLIIHCPEAQGQSAGCRVLLIGGQPGLSGTKVLDGSFPWTASFAPSTSGAGRTVVGAGDLDGTASTSSCSPILV